MAVKMECVIVCMC